MQHDLTRGPITRTMLLFAGPMIAGNLLQQFYNIADTLIVGQFLGAQALAAVGSAFTLMTFLTSILLGLCMGSGAVFSIQYGRSGMRRQLKTSIFVSFVLIAPCHAGAERCSPLCCWTGIIRFLNIPAERLRDDAGLSLAVSLPGIPALSFSIITLRLLLRSGGQLRWCRWSFWPSPRVHQHRAGSAVCRRFSTGAWRARPQATVIAQVAVRALASRSTTRHQVSRPCASGPPVHALNTTAILQGDHPVLSLLTCIQQSVMNFGILLVQGLVNSFGTACDGGLCGGGQNRRLRLYAGAGFRQRLFHLCRTELMARKRRSASAGASAARIGVTVVFCLTVSALVFVFARQLMLTLCRSRRRPRFWRWGRSTCASRAPSTAGLAACFCSTASTARCAVRASRWCSPSSRWAQGWCCPTCWPPFRPSGWWGSGGPSRLDGCLPTWRGCSITKSLKSSCWNNCKKSKKEARKRVSFFMPFGRKLPLIRLSCSASAGR